MTWARFMESPERTVGLTRLVEQGVVVSTVFLGLDHSFGGGPPLWFETMVFPEDSMREQEMDRCSTYDEAEAMHIRMVEKWMRRDATKAIPPPS